MTLVVHTLFGSVGLIGGHLVFGGLAQLLHSTLQPWQPTSQHLQLACLSVTVHIPCKAFLSDPLPCLTTLPSDLTSRQLRHGNWSFTLPSLPVVVPVPSLVKEEGSAFILSWVQPCKLLPCLWCLRLILGRLWVGLWRSVGHAGFLCLISVGLVSGVAIFLKKFAALLGLYYRHLEP